MIATSRRFVLQSKGGLCRHLQQHSRVCVALVARPASRTTRFAHHPFQRQRGITSDPKLSAIFQGAGMGKVAISSSAYVQVNRQFACIQPLPAQSVRQYRLRALCRFWGWAWMSGIPLLLSCYSSITTGLSQQHLHLNLHSHNASSTFALNINKDRTPDPGTCSMLEKVFRGFVFSTK